MNNRRGTKAWISSGCIRVRECKPRTAIAARGRALERDGPPLALLACMPTSRDQAPRNATTPLWRAQAELPVHDAPVPSELHTGVCIVGAGISGLSVAYALARDGVAVTVVDDGPIGGGETG